MALTTPPPPLFHPPHTQTRRRVKVWIPSVVEVFTGEVLLVLGQESVEGAAGVGRGHWASGDAVQLLQRFVLSVVAGLVGAAA